MGISVPRFEFRHAAAHWQNKYFDLGKGDSPPPPDYTPLANASSDAAQIMANLGREQLAEAKRQYDINMSVARPVIDAQLSLMDQTRRQGDEYFNYWKANAQPVEGQLRAQALQEMSPSYWEQLSNQAVADSQAGYTRALNQAFRQARRYGLSPVSTAGSQVIQQAQSTAAMANAARQQGRNLGFARGMDVSGLYRGMPGASAGAYGLMLNSGNSAVANAMQPSNQYLTGLAMGASSIGQGQGMRIQGLSNVLNAQTSYANALNANSGGGLGALLGLAGQLGSAWILKP